MSYTLWDGHSHPAPHYKPPMGPISQGYSHVVYRLTNYTDTSASLITSPVMDTIKTDDVSAGTAGVFSVVDYGAAGDGRTVDSAAVRKAFAACAAAKGGTVLFPAHQQYLTGPFNISSDTTVLIEANATILGNPDKRDWPIIMPLPWMGKILRIAELLCIYMPAIDRP